MKICILGSTGYLGSRLASRLVRESGANSVYCVHRAASDISRIKALVESDMAVAVLSDSARLRELFASVKFDCIINASCSYANGTAGEEIIESNFAFPARVLAIADSLRRNSGEPALRFISVGTGLPDGFNLYSFTKKQMNDMGRFVAEGDGVQFVNIELENFYGPDEPPNRFLHWCVSKLINNEPVPLTTGEQRRDFVYIEDVLDAIELIAKHLALPQYMDLPLAAAARRQYAKWSNILRKRFAALRNCNLGRYPLGKTNRAAARICHNTANWAALFDIRGKRA